MAIRTPQSKMTPQTFSEPTFSSRPERSSKKTIIFALIVLILAGLAYYFFTKYQELKENPNAISEAEAMELALEVGKIMVLPEDEVPTIATVSDPELLKDQPFFKNAQKGYKVLIYSQAGRAILYDPEAKKIIEVAPIDNGETEPPQTVTTEVVPEE